MTVWMGEGITVFKKEENDPGTGVSKKETVSARHFINTFVEKAYLLST
ncbi:hypothetical protein [Salibacterium aidingense]|nr:hypothetical protein [Salibacterium aidingense]